MPRFFAVLRKERVFLMIGLLIASSALHAQERRPTRGERLAIDPSLTEANLDRARARYHAGDLDGADAASTTDVFDYDQHVVGLVLNVSFARSR